MLRPGCSAAFVSLRLAGVFIPGLVSETNSVFFVSLWLSYLKTSQKRSSITRTEDAHRTTDSFTSDMKASRRSSSFTSFFVSDPDRGAGFTWRNAAGVLVQVACCR
ncbi:hypothetical protein AMECASPLE_026748 [Ameca splendens]|uniref:Secreted protein n=1 Tax=Ameca splendens TaxID=208324 RepID=A0ABV1ADH1_9TELE